MEDELKIKANPEGAKREPPHEKKRYTPPALRRLGTVRDLTLTKGKTITESRSAFKRM